MGGHCTSERRTALYRFYDDHENLLYIGISNDPWRRWREHVLAKPWYPQVKHQSVTWYDTEHRARNAERCAIRSEGPRFNIAGAVRPPEASLKLRFDVVIQACLIWMCIPGLVGVAAIFLTAIPNFNIGPVVTASCVGLLSLPVPIVALAVVGSPWIYRFGRWLDLNFSDRKGWPRRSRSVVAIGDRR